MSNHSIELQYKGKEDLQRVIPRTVTGVTRGFNEDFALREKYEKEGFGLETVFEKKEWAEDRIKELKAYGLNEGDIRLVNHISSRETGEKPTWEVYVKAGKGLPVLFLNADIR